MPLISLFVFVQFVVWAAVNQHVPEEYMVRVRFSGSLTASGTHGPRTMHREWGVLYDERRMSPSMGPRHASTAADASSNGTLRSQPSLACTCWAPRTDGLGFSWSTGCWAASARRRYVSVMHVTRALP